jgi:hypothetical protein
VVGWVDGGSDWSTVRSCGAVLALVLRFLAEGLLMGDGRTCVVLLWEARAMSEQNLLVSAGSAPAGSAPAPNSFSQVPNTVTDI